MTKQTFIENLYQKRAIYNDPDQAHMIANLLDTVSSDIYSESQRFVFELIQNADDAAKNNYNEVHFDFLTNCLIISHNGQPFEESDIISLTSAGSSTKRSDPTKTGYKGIGFKSVFGKSERVTIISNGYQFRFDKKAHQSKMPWQIIPIWTELNELDDTIQKRLTNKSHSVATIIEVKKLDSLLSELNELLDSAQILLFLRRVSKILVSHNGNTIYSIEKSITTQHESFSEVTLSKDEKVISTWATKNFEKIPITLETKEALKHDEKTPEKLKEADFTEISFAAKIDEGKLVSLKKEESLIFTYLPTKVSDFWFPFLVNGSFLTNAAREGLHEDRIWNQWLFTIIADKILDWLEMLAKGKFKFGVLQLLPPKFNSTHNELKKSFDQSLSTNATLKAFVPSKSLKLKRPLDIVVDKTGLSELSFITPDTLIEFINQKQNAKYKSDSLVHEELQRTDKLWALGSSFFDAENLESFFLSSIFKENHKPSQNFLLIEYFYNKATKDESKEWNERLKTLPFVFSDSNLIKSPHTICFPSLNFETEFGGEVTVIHSEVFSAIENNSKIKSWLERLGVKDPSDLAFLENEIIGNIENFIDLNNCQKITRYILNLHRKAFLTDLHYEKLQNLKILTTGKELLPAKQCYLSDLYEPQLKLEKVNEAGKYVAEYYKQPEDYVSEWKTFFLKIGVSENISVINITTDSNGSNGIIEPAYFTEVGAHAKKDHRYPHLVGPSNPIKLDRIRFAEFANDYIFAKIFWQQAIKTIYPESIRQNGYMPWGYFGSSEAVQNYFFWSLNHSAIFPATTKQCHPAKEVFINQKEIADIAGRYLPVFDYDDPLPENWKNVLPFKQSLELNDYLSVLEKITEQTEDDEIIRKYNKKRIGLVYNKLASLLSDFSDVKKHLIIDWAKKHQLLSTSGNFENAHELKWIRIEGFTIAAEKLKVIQIPENCEAASKAFEDLITLFQVQIIDKFFPTFENDTRDLALQSKLQTALPYFVAIIEKKQYQEYSKEFERLFSILFRVEFYNTSSIKLSFTYQSETIEGPSLNVFIDSYKLYFKGKWKSPITMFSLIPELANLLGIAGLNDELRLLLELEEAEIIEWLTGLGYNISDIKSKPEYLKSKQQFTISQVAPIQKDTSNGTISEVSVEDDLKLDIDEPYPIKFEPVSQPKAFDTASIPVITKKFEEGRINTEMPYSEIQNQETREDVGKWCEEFVNEILTRENGNLSKFIWVNKDSESGLPYDFKITTNGVEKYIDVKGTPSANKDIIYLSAIEWKFMLNQGENYSIYRVYNAGQLTPKIDIIENPRDLLIHGKILPNPITLQI
jgi:hypothetical protein